MVLDYIRDPLQAITQYLHSLGEQLPTDVDAARLRKIIRLVSSQHSLLAPVDAQGTFDLQHLDRL